MRALSLCAALALGACTTTAARDAGASLIRDAAPDARSDGSTPDAGSLERDAGADAGQDAGPAEPTLDERIDALGDPSASATDLDALLGEVAWAGGWPLTDGRRWLFATRWDDPPGAVALVSDVNGWTPAPAARASSGVHFYVVLDATTFAVAADGAKYKWHGAPDTFRAPPEATAYGYDDFGEFGYVAPPLAERYRERFPGLDSRFLDDDRALRAYLPAGFSRGDAARVLLLHDGQNVLHPDAAFGGWRVDEAIAAPGYEDVVVLAVDNARDRVDAYTHVADDLGDGSLIGGRADDYASLLFEEALPFFRARYGLRASRDDLVIGGSSLGGLVSLYLAMTREADMRCVIAMSSMLGWGAFAPGASGAEAIVRRWDRHGSVAVYLDSGGDGTCSDADGDGVSEDSDDSDNYCTTLQLRDRLLDLGYSSDVDLFHRWERGAPHNEFAWARRMPNALSACVGAGWTVSAGWTVRAGGTRRSDGVLGAPHPRRPPPTRASRGG